MYGNANYSTPEFPKLHTSVDSPFGGNNQRINLISNFATASTPENLSETGSQKSESKDASTMT